ncbi:MAG: hypothetical protein ACYDCO_09590 [Armatimonadota bacterium]
MPVIIYPPNLPLHERVVFHRQDQESRWGAPIPFVPFLIFTAIVYLFGLWAVSNAESWEMFNNLGPDKTLLIMSLIPAIILVGTILIYPHISSPLFSYKMALMQDEFDQQVRWNLAVVSTAHIYCGREAQVEWINLLETLTTEDRQLALGFIKRVCSRLQQIPVLTARDWTTALIVCLAAFIISVLFLVPPGKLIHAVFHSLTLIIVVQLFMLYLYTQRWQHIRRLQELLDIFEELTPLRRAQDVPPREDEVTRWTREQEERFTLRTGIGEKKYVPPSQTDAPPVPWEE